MENVDSSKLLGDVFSGSTSNGADSDATRASAAAPPPVRVAVSRGCCVPQTLHPRTPSSYAALHRPSSSPACAPGSHMVDWPTPARHVSAPQKRFVGGEQVQHRHIEAWESNQIHRTLQPTVTTRTFDSSSCCTRQFSPGRLFSTVHRDGETTNVQTSAQPRPRSEICPPRLAGTHVDPRHADGNHPDVFEASIDSIPTSLPASWCDIDSLQHSYDQRHVQSYGCRKPQDSVIVDNIAPDNHRRISRRHQSVLLPHHITHYQKHHSSELPNFSLPLHVNSVARADINLLRSWMSPDRRARFDIYSSVCNLSTYSHFPPGTFLSHGPPRCDLSSKDVEMLLAADLIHVITESEVRGHVRTFTINETSKNRRRWIVHPWLQNDILPLPPEFHIDDVLLPCTTHIQQSREYTVAATNDIKSCFHSFSLGPAKIYYCFQHEDTWYCITTIPTGGRYSPFEAQLATLTLSEHNSRSGVKACHIDNVLFGGTNALHNARNFVANCTATRFSVNEKAACRSSYDFLGMHFHHETDHVRVSIAQKTLDKIGAIHIERSKTLRGVLGDFGRLVYAADILSIPKHSFYVIYKFLRRRCGHRLDELTNIWECSIPAWRAWLATATTNTPRIVERFAQEHRPPTILFTDASGVGWGAVAFQGDGSVVSTSGAWPTGATPHINVLEARATVNALSILQLSGPIHVLVDNTTWLAVARKGYSRNFALNNLVGCFRKFGVTEMSYVASEHNEADYLSRNPQTPTTSSAGIREEK